MQYISIMNADWISSVIIMVYIPSEILWERLLKLSKCLS